MKRNPSIAAAAVVLSIAGLMLWRSQDGALAASPPSAPLFTPSPASGPQNEGQRAKVDIVFALDTTSSMSELIEGAKSKIWEIARRAQQGQPAPEVRIGLVAYRDVGDEYVTKVLDLTGDLDQVYASLNALTASGGGDGPEHVIKGLHDAVNGVQWSTGPRTVKLVYLVGDAAPHEDYHDGLTMAGVLGDAHRRGIRISAIRCGHDEATLAAWTSIAQRTDGEVSTIEQNGGVRAAITTPYDADLARLNAELAKTEVHWGSRAERAAAADVLATNMAAPAVAQADRAGFYAAQAHHGGPTKQDLAAADPTALAAVAPADLPDEMQRMSPEERTRFVTEKRVRREAVLGEIKEASAKREATLKAAPAPRVSPSSFDAKVIDSLRKAGASSSIVY